jgi:1-aminocyclopropane-1-carboxylate deaminase/D-cysteine desulfhydrase-like pyridoxal-dependent ACC family enzyme
MVRLHHLKISVVAVALAACAQSASAQGAKVPAKALANDDTREVNMRAYTELLRSDLRAQKVAIITEVMQFTEAEDTKFWPVYREYEAELAKINDDRMALIKDYADNYAALTDVVADKLARRALDLEARRHALRTTYYDRIKLAVSPKTAARFMQVEHQILLLLDLQIAASLPLAKH